LKSEFEKFHLLITATAGIANTASLHSNAMIARYDFTKVRNIEIYLENDLIAIVAIARTLEKAEMPCRISKSTFKPAI